MIMSVRISETGSWDYNGNSSFDISNDLDTKLSDYIINFLKEKNILATKRKNKACFTAFITHAKLIYFK